LPEEPPEKELCAFLKAIREDPDDDTPRLVFADWLDEHGDRRGDMIRLSIEEAHTPYDTPRWKELRRLLAPWDAEGAALEGWIGELEEGGVWVDGFDRGLFHVLVHQGDTEEEETPEFWAAVRQGWAGKVSFADGWGVFDDLASGGWPSLRATPYITAWGQRGTVDSCLEGPATLVNLREFELDDYRWGDEPRVTDAGLAHLCKNRNLESLKVYGRFTRKGVARLASLRKLRHLRVDGVEGDLKALTAELRRKLPECEICLSGPRN
jgi:uncharacterized protein (TIGR02996 family)